MDPAPIAGGDITVGTIWLLIATALVIFMTPGLAFFYGGLVKAKSVVSMAMLSFGAGVWLPEMFRRTFEWSPAKTALHIGVIGLIVAPFGLMTGGALAERFAKRGYDDANLRVLQIATLAVIPTSIAFCAA